MSYTPDVIINKPRKFLHDLLNGVAAFAGLLAIAGFLTGGSYVFALLVAIGCAVAASKIKFRLVKRVEAATYEYV